MDVLDVATARWLVGDGRDVVDRVTAALDDDTAEYAVVERLRGDGLTPPQSSAVLAAAAARRRARATWPDADRLLFTREALEQASDPAVSAWRTRRLGTGPVWDLCAGVGGDALAAADHGAEVTAVDLDAARLVLLEHNARQRGLAVTTRCADVLEVDVPTDAFVHADPGRRRDGRRVRRLAEHLPPVGALLAAHAGARGSGVVLSPAVDLADPDLPAAAELEFVQVSGDLRESILWTGELRAPEATATATLLPSGVTRSRPGGERQRLPVGPPGTVLIRVVPAAIRARLHDQIGHEIDARRLANSRALLTADAVPPASDWYRAALVHAVLPVRTKAVRSWLRDVDVDAVEIATHGIDVDVSAWWRAIGRPPRGPAGWRIDVVRTDDGGCVLITRDADAAAA